MNIVSYNKKLPIKFGDKILFYFIQKESGEVIIEIPSEITIVAENIELVSTNDMCIDTKGKIWLNSQKSKILKNSDCLEENNKEDIKQIEEKYEK